MATYRLSPTERLIRARLLKEQNETYKKIPTVRRVVSQPTQVTTQPKATTASNKGAVRRGLETAGDIGINVTTGLLKGIEGIVDMGASLAGLVGGEFQKDVRDFVSTDWTTKFVGNPLGETVDGSYLNSDGVAARITKQVASGVGQMLPAVAAAFFTGGASAGVQAAVQGANLAYMGASAGGNATEEAFNDGSNYGLGVVSGMASGAVEAATEKLTGGLTSGLFGKGVIKTGNKVASQGAKRVLKGALEEGFEEAVSEALSPATKAIYKGKDALKEYGTKELWGDVGEAALVGGLTSAAVGGSGIALSNKIHNRTSNLNESTSTISDLNRKKNKAFKDGSLTQEAKANLDKATLANYGLIEKELKKYKSDKRAKLIKNYGLENIVEADGSVKQSVREELSGAGYFSKYVSPNVKEDSLNNTLKTISDDVAKTYALANNVNIKKAKQAVGEVKVFDGVLDKSAEANYTDVKEVISKIDELSNTNTNIVIVNENKGFNGLITDNTVYLSAEQLKSDVWKGTIIHEELHNILSAIKKQGKAQGMNELIRHLSTNESVINNAIISVSKKGYVSDSQINEILEKSQAGETLTQQEQDIMNVYEEEVLAHASEQVLIDSKVIDKLLKTDANIFLRMYNTIRNLIDVFKGATNKEYAYLKKAENLYIKAIKDAGYVYSKGELKKMTKESEVVETKPKENTDKKADTKDTEVKANGKIMYSLNKTFAEQVDELLKEKDFEASHLLVSQNTPKIYLDLGMSNYPMLITATHARTAMGVPVKGHNAHRLSLETLKQIPKKLQEPVLIMESVTRDDSIVVFVDALDIDKKPVVCAIKVDVGHGNYNHVEIDANIILSVYGKEGNVTKLIENAVNENRVLYWDKKKSQALFDTPGLQLSDNINTLDSNTIIRKFGEKSTTKTKNLQKNNEIRYSLPDIDNYSENEYNDYGWVRANEILTKRQWADFSAKFAEAKTGHHFEKSLNGEFIIPVHNGDSVDNVLVFAKGTFESPEVTKIIEIDLYNETELDKVRRRIYEAERRGVQYEVEELFRFHYPTDYEFDQYKRGISEVGRDSSGQRADGRRSGGEAKKIKSIHVEENGQQVVTYQDGTTEIRNASSETDSNSGGNVDGKYIVADSKNKIKYNLKTYNEGGRDKLRNALQEHGFEAEDINRTLETVDKIADFMDNLAKEGDKSIGRWNKAEIQYESDGKPYSALVKNGDYELNLDLSTICAKRIDLDNIMNLMADNNILASIDINPVNIAKIRDILKKHGLQTACEACFVESKRMRVDSWAEDFVKAWNKAVGYLKGGEIESLDFVQNKSSVSNGASLDTTGLEKAIKDGVFERREERLIALNVLNNPKIRGLLKKTDLTTSKGIDTIRKTHNDLYARIKNKAGSATPKLLQPIIPYNNELIGIKDLSKRAEAVGGVRMFSFSDFTIDQVFDYLQVIADLVAKKSTMHTYTKVISFAKLFGQTGIKINLSVIPAVDRNVGKANAGLDANGELIWGEYSVDIDEARKLMAQEGYSSNVGMVAIGVSDNHIKKLLDTDYINYIIPYHKSGINPHVAQEMKIDFYTDYTDFQNTRVKEGRLDIKYAKGARENYRGKSKKIGSGDFEFFHSLAKHNGDAKAMAKEYLEFCDKNNYVPRFEKFTYHENYWKLLVDYRVYDAVTGEVAPQKPATLKIPNNFQDIIKEELKVRDKNNRKFKENYRNVIGDIIEELSLKDVNKDDLKSKIKDFKLDDEKDTTQTKEIHYSLKKGSETISGKDNMKGEPSTITEGTLKKTIANFSQARKYQKTDAITAVNEIIDNSDFKEYFTGITKSTKVSIADTLWQLLNTMSIRKTTTADDIKNMTKKISDLIAKDRNVVKELSDEDVEAFKAEVQASIVETFANKGLVTYHRKLVNTVFKWREKYIRNVVREKLVRDIAKAKNIKAVEGNYTADKRFREILSKFNAVAVKGTKVRDILAELNTFYAKENEVIGQDYNEEVKSIIQILSNGKGGLTSTDMKLLDDVIKHFKFVTEHYNKVFHNGKWIDIIDKVDQYAKVIEEDPNKHTIINAKIRYAEAFDDPMSLARAADGYQNGVHTETINAMRLAETNFLADVIEVKKDIDAFYKENKNFRNDLRKKTITVNGSEVSRAKALDEYMILGRKQLQMGAIKNGFSFKDNLSKGQAKDQIMTPFNERATESTLEEDVKKAREELYSKFTEKEKEWLKIVRKAFDDCKELKRQTDIQQQGFSNVTDEEYVPGKRANIVKSIDTPYIEELDSVSNLSFNKDTVKGAQGMLILEDLDLVLDRHINGIALYKNLAPVIKTFDRVANFNTSTNRGRPVTIKQMASQKWVNGYDYLKKLLGDIQQRRMPSDVGSKLISKLRSNYAVFQIAGNMKVLFTQISSFFASGRYLSIGSWFKGMGVKLGSKTWGEKMDKYSKVARTRNYEKASGVAMGVLDSTTKLQRAFMTPISKIDRMVNMGLFKSCIVEVESKKGLKIGSEENFVEAGKLLDTIIYETQQNAQSSERSAAMRSSNEIIKSLTMFSADSLKIFSRVVDSWGEARVLKKRIRKAEAELRNATEPKVKAEKQAEIDKLKKAQKETRANGSKAVGSLVVTAIWMAAVSQLFRTLFKKDDEEDEEYVEKIMTNVSADLFGNLFGGLPLIRDLYSLITDNFDIDNPSISTINELLKSASTVVSLATDFANDGITSQRLASATKQVLFAVGQGTGIPTRNVYNLATGLTKRFSRKGEYKIDNMFYDLNYRSDLAKAIENEDEDMIQTIAGLIMNEDMGSIKSQSVRNEISSLVKKGYDVLPRVPDSVTFEGETIKLSERQKDALRDYYGIANKALEDLFKSYQYKNANEEVRAKAIKYIWDVYYDLGKEEVLDIGIINKHTLFAEAIDIEKLALVVAQVNSITATKEASKKILVQRYVNSLRLSAVQKYMIMGYLGYKNINGESSVKSYINRLNLDKNEKELLMSYSGYEA